MNLICTVQIIIISIMSSNLPDNFFIPSNPNSNWEWIKLKTKLKIIIALFLLLAFLGAIVPDTEIEDEDISIVETTEPLTPLTFEEQVIADIDEANADNAHPVMDVTIDNETNYLQVRIAPGYMSDHGYFQRTIARNTFEIMDVIVSNDYDVDGVQVYSVGPLMNQKGNEVNVVIYDFQISMAYANTVNWEDLQWVEDPLRSAELNADYFFLHPAMR